MALIVFRMRERSHDPTDHPHVMDHLHVCPVRSSSKNCRPASRGGSHPPHDHHSDHAIHDMKTTTTTTLTSTLVLTRTRRSSSLTRHANCQHRRNSNGSVTQYITSTAGVKYDSIRVLNKAETSHGVVYYFVHVSCQENPLDSYTIRRRYNDFKSFHAALSRHMRPAPLSSILSYTTSHPRYYGIKRIDEDGSRTSSSNSSSSHHSHHDTRQHHARDGRRCGHDAVDDADDERESCRSGPSHGHTSMSSACRNHDHDQSEIDNDSVHEHHENATCHRTQPPSFVLRQETYDDDDDDDDEKIETHVHDHALSTNVYLPPMPIGGLVAIMTSKEALVRSRIAIFNRILDAALEATFTSVGVRDAISNFIKEAPGGSLWGQASLSLSPVEPQEDEAVVEHHHRDVATCPPSCATSSLTSSSSSAAAAAATAALPFESMSRSSRSNSTTASTSYVSLRDYAAPELTLSLEREARRSFVRTSHGATCEYLRHPLSRKTSSSSSSSSLSSSSSSSFILEHKKSMTG
jgi:hypothetical protein